ncbi:MAG: hypothetical protein RL717_2396, partial [Pseudomonadota bacterium]
MTELTTEQENDQTVHDADPSDATHHINPEVLQNISVSIT